VLKGNTGLTDGEIVACERCAIVDTHQASGKRMRSLSDVQVFLKTAHSPQACWRGCSIKIGKENGKGANLDTGQQN